MSLSLSLAEARRLALAAQGFDGRRTRRSVQRRHLREMLARLGLLQIDSVNALVRSHYLPLFSRLGPYSMTLLDEAAWVSAVTASCSNTGGTRPRCCRWNTTR